MEVARGTYVPPPTAAVVYGAMLIDEGTRTGVSILYVSAPRCSKRCVVRVRAYLREVTWSTDLELDGEHGGKTLDREPFVRLL